MAAQHYGIILHRVGAGEATYADVDGLVQSAGPLSGTPAGLTGRWATTELQLGLARAVVFHVICSRDGNLGDVTVSFTARLRRGTGADPPQAPVLVYDPVAAEWASSVTIPENVESKILQTPNFALLDDPQVLVSGAGVGLTAGDAVTVICTADQ